MRDLLRHSGCLPAALLFLFPGISSACAQTLSPGTSSALPPQRAGAKDSERQSRSLFAKSSQDESPASPYSFHSKEVNRQEARTLSDSFRLNTAVERSFTRQGILARCAADTDVSSPFASFRGGVVVSPVLSFAGGLDATFPNLGVSRDFAGRFDVDFLTRFNSPSFGSLRDARVGLNFCEVYTPGGVNRGRWYGGAGLGYYFGKVGHFGGKAFIGTNFSPTIGLELGAHFTGAGQAQLAVQMRLSAL